MQRLSLIYFLLLSAVIFSVSTQAQSSDSLRKSMEQQTLLPSKNDSVSPGKTNGDSIIHPILLPQQDSLVTPVKKKWNHTPKGATIRSLILPGWGQAYNREYWKVPLALAAVGIPAYIFIDCNNEYKKARFAYNAVYQSLEPNSNYPGATGDASQIPKMDQKFIDAYNYAMHSSANGKINFLTSIQAYRNQFRQYRDYSILAFFIGWGVNVADATVFGHLREFDVSPDLSMRISPAFFQYARVPGITLNFTIK